MGRKVLLVYPELPPTYWSLRYALPFIGKKAVFPPLGLLTVAALLPPDFEPTLVDLNLEPLPLQLVAEAELVFISAMLVQKESMARVVQLCRSVGTPVVAGGPYPTACWDEISGVDHFVLDEAEVTLPAFLQDLARGVARSRYTSAERPDLRRTPPPRFDLVRGKGYAQMAVQFSRGCPHQCEFCDIIELFGRNPRTKTPAQILRELDLLYGEGWRGSLFFVDDNFIGNRRDVKLLLPELARWQRARHHPFALFTEASLDLAEDDELLDQMVQAGFNMVFLGLETPDPCTLAAVGKAQNLRSDMLGSIRKIQRAGMEVSGGFIVGFDSDAEDIFDRQIRFIQEAAIPSAMVGLLTALPRTRLHRRLEAEGRLEEGPGGGNNTHDLRLNFLPRMDPRKLLEGYKRVLAEIYRPDRYFDRCLGLLKTLRPHRTSRRRIRLPEIRALVLSLVRQTFSRYGWAYWRYLVRGLLVRPRMAAETVTMAVKGHHFFQITRGVLELDRFKLTLDEWTCAFEAKFRQSTPARLADLMADREHLLQRMRARYRRLHKDFRTYADDAADAFQRTLDERIRQVAHGSSAR